MEGGHEGGGWGEGRERSNEEGETGRGAMGRGKRRAMRRGKQGGGNREGDTGRRVGDREGDDGEGATGWVRWRGGNGKGEMGRGDGDGGNGKEDMRRGKRKGEMGKLAKGRGRTRGKRRGISQMDIKCLGGHIECLCGTRLQSFLALFTRATPGTPASLLY